MKSPKSLALLSGGLDSLLAAKLIMNQGIQVEGINFFTGFTGVGSACVQRGEKKAYDAQWVADQLGIKLHVVDVVTAFKEVLINPKYGYGAHLNPCLDCKCFMVQQALVWMREHGFDFLITGEVLGQRPMSQRKDTLPIVARNTDDRLLRPLSAKLLPPTLPEKEGWVKRELLCDFSGRSRKMQIALAKQFGFHDYPQPAGGCILTEDAYTRRLQDFWQQQGSQDYILADIMLLKVGRHSRPKHNFKMIVGHDQLDNEFLAKYQDRYLSMHSASFAGPLVLCVGQMSEDDLRLAAQITAYFGKGRREKEVAVVVCGPNNIAGVPNKAGVLQQLMVMPIAEVLEQWYI